MHNLNQQPSKLLKKTSVDNGKYITILGQVYKPRQRSVILNNGEEVFRFKSF